jgi:hypothetical protein
MVLRFVSILPFYKRMSRPADSTLLVTVMAQLCSVDTVAVPESGIGTIVPSIFHSGLLVSVGNGPGVRSGAAHAQPSVLIRPNIDKRERRTHAC